MGGGYSCRVQFPDAGFYWYHPHIREDFAQEMGLYGTIVVDPADAAYWPAVDRELTLTLDDLLVEDGHIAAVQPVRAQLHRDGPVRQRHADQRGDLVHGCGDRGRGRAPVPGQHREHPDLQLRRPRRTHQAGRRRQRSVRARDVRRRGVAGSVGAGRRSTCCSRPPGEVRLEHRTPDRVYDLGGFSVAADAGRGRGGLPRPSRRCGPTPSSPRSAGARPTWNDRPTRCSRSSPGCRCSTARTTRRRRRTRARCTRRSPRRAGDVPEVRDAADRCRRVSYACPMHPDVTASEPGTCPRCGMKLVPADRCPVRRPRARRPRPRRRAGVGGPDAGDQPGVGHEQHDLAAHRPRDGRGERRDRLGVHRRATG